VPAAELEQEVADGVVALLGGALQLKRVEAQCMLDQISLTVERFGQKIARFCHADVDDTTRSSLQGNYPVAYGPRICIDEIYLYAVRYVEYPILYV
jgi:hypothetical protein